MPATAYITQDDIVPLRIPMKQFVQLTNDDAKADAPDDDVVSLVIAEACATVDSFCGQRYALPLQRSVVVVSLARDIAVYEFYKRRNQSRDGDMITTGYTQAISRLREIAAGKASLDQPDAPLDPQMASGEAVVTRIPQVFSDANLGGW